MYISKMEYASHTTLHGISFDRNTVDMNLRQLFSEWLFYRLMYNTFGGDSLGELLWLNIMNCKRRITGEITNGRRG